jgi:hypothetical protein
MFSMEKVKSLETRDSADISAVHDVKDCGEVARITKTWRSLHPSVNALGIADKFDSTSSLSTMG